MQEKLLHTTEGVRDFYGSEYADRILVSEKIRDVMEQYGYSGVDTPTFEYFDLFVGELSETSTKELYKFFDKEGATIVLRPDFTPSMARCAAKYFLEDALPYRMYYQGKTFMNTSSLQGKLNEYTQTGAELINSGNVYADAEMIALLAESLLRAGLDEFQISVGNVSYFEGLCEAYGLSAQVKEDLREHIAGKNFFAAEKLLLSKEVSPEGRALLLQGSVFLKDRNDLTQAAAKVTNEKAKAALLRLSEVDRILSLYGVDRYVSYDLGMLNRYNYYTGIIFKAYAYGVGDAIASGGRYDKLLEKFGKDVPAIGFSVLLDDLMSALYHTKKAFAAPDETIAVTTKSSDADQILLQVINDRKKGKRVAFQVMDE